LESKNDTLFTKINEYESNIKGLSAEEFPLIPKIKNKKLFSIPTKGLKEIINMVSFAAALDEARPVLSGVYFKTEKNKLTLAATDSYRLVEKTTELKQKDMAKKEAIIPARSLIEFSRILESSDEGEVNVYLDETQVMFETEDVEFTSRLIEGQFPDYDQIIPGAFETKANVPVSEFVNIIKVVSLFSRESAGSVNIEVKKGKIEASSSASQYGDSNASCEAEVTGKDSEIVFNSRYLLDVAGVLSGEKVSLELNGKLNPGVLRKENDKSFVYVIMPLRA